MIGMPFHTQACKEYTRWAFCKLCGRPIVHHLVCPTRKHGFHLWSFSRIRFKHDLTTSDLAHLFVGDIAMERGHQIWRREILGIANDLASLVGMRFCFNPILTSSQQPPRIYLFPSEDWERATLSQCPKVKGFRKILDGVLLASHPVTKFFPWRGERFHTGFLIGTDVSAARFSGFPFVSRTLSQNPWRRRTPSEQSRF
ncbi:hypothetical protein Tco_1056936 [Tanacetum coccineum]|uniref:Uncharacterized protein n=1 Tax=Tanacetum coccineum TaxID=301880 RepID=A0ABQ5H4P9_9ASTR